MIVTITNLKGGTGKTTTAVYLACLLAKEGRTLLVDGDPQGSATLWAEEAAETGTPLPFTTDQQPSDRLGTYVTKKTGEYDNIVVDTPPGHESITLGALKVSDTVIITMSTGMADLMRYGATVDLVEATQALNPKLKAYTLITKARANTTSRRTLKAALDQAAGIAPVFEHDIPLREAIGAAAGTLPEDLTQYTPIVDQLLGRLAK